MGRKHDANSKGTTIKAERGADKKIYIPFTDKDAEKFARDGERYASRGFVKSYGFEETIAFVMSLTQQIWELLQKNKSFRMELYYDAELLNTNYCFFIPTDRCGSDDIGQVSPEDQC